MFKNIFTKINSIFLLIILSLIAVSLLANVNSSGPHLDRLMAEIERQEKVFPFSEFGIFLEQNHTDQDSEIVVFAEGQDEGIQEFWLFSPEQKLVYHLDSPQTSHNIGGREILIESPEPSDLSLILNAYPEGEYTFIAKTFASDWLFNQIFLSHIIPPAASIIYPLDNESILAKNFEIIWESGEQVEKFLLEISNESNELDLEVEISATSKRFSVPSTG